MKKTIVILRRLHSETRRDDLEYAFGRFGRLLEVSIAHDANMAWIEFEYARDARDAVSNPISILGHWVKMYLAYPIDDETDEETDEDNGGFMRRSSSGVCAGEYTESESESESKSESESESESESDCSGFDSEYSESDGELDSKNEPGNEMN